MLNNKENKKQKYSLLIYAWNFYFIQTNSFSENFLPITMQSSLSSWINSRRKQKSIECQLKTRRRDQRRCSESPSQRNDFRCKRMIHINNSFEWNNETKKEKKSILYNHFHSDLFMTITRIKITIGKCCSFDMMMVIACRNPYHHHHHHQRQ